MSQISCDYKYISLNTGLIYNNNNNNDNNKNIFSQFAATIFPNRNLIIPEKLAHFQV